MRAISVSTEKVESAITAQLSGLPETLASTKSHLLERAPARDRSLDPR